MGKFGGFMRHSGLARLLSGLFAGVAMVSGFSGQVSADSDVARLAANPKIVDYRSPHWPELAKINAYGNWQMGNFALLDSWADRFRDPEVVTPDGFSYAAEYYSQFLNGRFLEGDEEYTKVWYAGYQKWVEVNPKSPVPHFLHAIQFRARAWHVRGEGYANTVANRDMASFAKLMTEARQVLVACQEICSRDSYWYHLMFDIDAALGANRELAMGRLLDGIEKFPKAHYLFTGAVNYLRPEWGGSEREVNAWAKFAARMTKADSGDELYARVYSEAAKYATLNKWDGYPDGHRVRVLAGMRQVLAKYPTQENYTGFIDAACRARSKEDVEMNWRLRAVSRKPPGAPEIDAEDYCGWGKIEPAARRNGVAAPGGPQKAKGP
jgi:hypothetical protein